MQVSEGQIQPSEKRKSNFKSSYYYDAQSRLNPGIKEADMDDDLQAEGWLSCPPAVF